MVDEKRLRIRVKMCGTTCSRDANFAVKCGVDALGFIFYRKSPRHIGFADVSTIIRQLPPFIDSVGVFVNGDHGELAAAAGAGLTCLQLHGSESPDYCLQLKHKLPSCRIIKAFRVGAMSRAEDFSPYNESVDGFLLDTYVEGAKGGTGATFDWSIIDRLTLQRPLLLAGGLTPENIVQAITAVKPYGVDVNSGIESQPGIKDHQRLQKLMQLVAGSGGC